MAERYFEGNHHFQVSLWDRFHAKIEVDPKCGCWFWTGAVKEYGHGVIGLGRRQQGIRKAHRVAWELYHGPISKGSCVLHRCHLSSCVNPAHLYIGTLKDNARDLMRTRRNYKPDNRGERAKWAKLTESAVRHIRKKEMPSIAYGRLYGVSGSAIREIWRGRNWRSITNP